MHAAVELKDDLAVSLRHWQFLAALGLIDQMDAAAARHSYRTCERPENPPLKCLADWWNYAARCVKQDIAAAPGLRVSWEGLRLRRQQRLAYVASFLTQLSSRDFMGRQAKP
eukprot:5732454-Prymnesium_polylepis.1